MEKARARRKEDNKNKICYFYRENVNLKTDSFLACGDNLYFPPIQSHSSLPSFDALLTDKMEE